jgi:hypothetical protein
VSDNRNGGPNLGLLLLIPAAAIVARAAVRHRQMMWAEVGEPGLEARYARHGHRHAGGPGFGPRSGPAARGELRLPPRIEWMLETWHARAHQAADAPDAADAADETATV